MYAGITSARYANHKNANVAGSMHALRTSISVTCSFAVDPIIVGCRNIRHARNGSSVRYDEEADIN